MEKDEPQQKSFIPKKIIDLESLNIESVPRKLILEVKIETEKLLSICDNYDLERLNKKDPTFVPRMFKIITNFDLIKRIFSVTGIDKRLLERRFILINRKKKRFEERLKKDENILQNNSNKIDLFREKIAEEAREIIFQAEIIDIRREELNRLDDKLVDEKVIAKHKYNILDNELDLIGEAINLLYKKSIFESRREIVDKQKKFIKEKKQELEDFEKFIEYYQSLDIYQEDIISRIIQYIKKNYLTPKIIYIFLFVSIIFIGIRILFNIK